MSLVQRRSKSAQSRSCGAWKGGPHCPNRRRDDFSPRLEKHGPEGTQLLRGNWLTRQYYSCSTGMLEADEAYFKSNNEPLFR